MLGHFKRKKARKEERAREEQARRDEEEEEAGRQAVLLRRQHKPCRWGKKDGSDERWSWDKAARHGSHMSDDEDDAEW
ncbi:hypothetical protein JCM8208_001431 [Rhodotorula glutinis]